MSLTEDVLAKRIRRLEVYRETPAAVPLRAREHYPACQWCRWSDRTRPFYCFAPQHNSTREKEFASRFNGRGQCNSYYPSRWTWLLQLLRLRPFVERVRKWEET